jgi:hypothetical protein
LENRDNNLGSRFIGYSCQAYRSIQLNIRSRSSSSSAILLLGIPFAVLFTLFASVLGRTFSGSRQPWTSS